MVTKSNLPHDKPQAQPKHPPEYEADLNPERLGGQNIGVETPDGIVGARSAADFPELYRRLPDFTQADLREIPILPEGARLEEGATYLDLKSEAPTPFTAHGVMRAGPDNWYVPKHFTPYPFWNRLIGIDDPTRIT